MDKDRSTDSEETEAKVSSRMISLQLNPKFIPMFFQLLGQGFDIDIQAGCTVKGLLCGQLGIQEDYLTRRIQTIFLNAKVVDDIDTAVVPDESTLALSGAMPGLVGAILRSGGYLAAMRNQISHSDNDAPSRAHSTRITLKLMNIVVRELGPEFLKNGILLKAGILQEFFRRHLDEIKPGWIAGEFAGKPLEPDNLLQNNWNAELVLLRVNSEIPD